jgi:hypothetical protein
MPNKKLRDGQPIGMGMKAPMGAKKPQKTGGKTPKQPCKAPKPRGGY